MIGNQPKCYRCGRESAQQLANGDYWCSWCGQAFDPKDEALYRKQEAGKKKELEKLASTRPLNVDSAVALSNQRTDAEICICSEYYNAREKLDHNSG